MVFEDMLQLHQWLKTTFFNGVEQALQRYFRKDWQLRL